MKLCFVDGLKRQGNQWKGRGMQLRARKDQERNGYCQRNKTEDSQIESSPSAKTQKDVRYSTISLDELAVQC